MTIYAYLDKNVKANNIREVLSGLSYETKNILNDETDIPDTGTCAVVHGVLRGNSAVIREAESRNLPWCYVDNAYFGKYKRVIFNATAPITFREGRRFEHNTQLEKWRGGQGDYILVLPPSPPYMDTFDCRNFLNYCAHTINQYTGKPIIVRAKPAKGRKAPPLEEQIRGAYAVVSWGSAVSLEALRLGIPTISLGWCPAKYSSFKMEDLETDKLLVEPPRMETFDNLTWSSFEREELPGSYIEATNNALAKIFDEIRPINNPINTL